MPTEKLKILDITPDAMDNGKIITAQLTLETDDGFVLNCDSDFPDEPLGAISKKDLLLYKSRSINCNIVFVPYEKTFKINEAAERKLIQKEATYEAEVSGEVLAEDELDNGNIKFDIDTGKFTFTLECKKKSFHPKVGEHVMANGDLRVEDIELI
ncbi:MAG: hypothetical protein Q8R00_02900 [Candidatus Nanoarchaeia archaeon]|nr:hypothetical protein [Candidatus Nanoarchaeia archaeon]